jgi:Fe-S-cluster-containing dehydrogenase component/formate-dependent nitrite reductase membrane component NrfD
VQLGFVIDHESCIGCHACTVACKAENNVPVGNFRTAVKYVEEGLFPDVRRMFLVQRCNHCTKAPCVTICPVNALSKRPDGIVDLDRDACIGCRACMQACPYDAIYLNEDLGAVEKCHYCAHRVEKNLEPACVIVCPVGAIISGDLHDPDSRIAQIAKQKETKVRRPEQGTGPNVRYVGVEDVMLNPGRAARPESYLWSDRPPHKPEPWPASVPVQRDARVVLDQGHRVEWGWGVTLYLVTKGLAGGAAMLAPFVGWLGLKGFAARFVPEIIALIFIALTGLLLVEDLKKPLAFVRLFTRPNWNSWLVKGAWVINAFVLLMAASLALRWLGMDAAADAVRWGGALAGVAVAGYTAFLFAQCEGRDLWQSKILLPHLLVQAVLCGAVALLPFDMAHGKRLPIIASIAAALHLMFALIERYRTHETENATQGAAFLNVVRLGSLRPWRDGLIIGVGVTVLFAFVLPAIAFIPALVGLLLYEHAFIRAGQLPPLS